MSCSLFSSTDLGYGVGFRWKEGAFKERVKEEAANRKVWRARRKHWEKQASRGTGFWIILAVAVSLPQWAAQNQALKMVTKPPARVLKWKVPFAYNLFKVILMKQRCSASPWQPFSGACTLSVNWHRQPLSPQVPRLSSHSMPSDM